MKPAKKFFILPLSIVCALIIYFITGFINFPGEISLLENTSHNLKFGLPIEATISADTVTTLSINNKPVSENITVSLNNPVLIESGESGKVNMTLNAFGIPLKKVTLDIMPDLEVVPCGMTVGVRIDTDGVMVLGTGYVNGEDGSAHKPSEGHLKSGDLIINANGKALQNKEELIRIIEESKEVKLEVKRNEETIETTIETVKSVNDKLNKLGIWVRDNTQGIGTVTYYNPSTGSFGALGHGIVDVDTKQLMRIKSGIVMESSIVSVKKGKKGVPGELIGDIKTDNVIGEIRNNNLYGLYGKIELTAKLPKETMKIASQDQVYEGPAVIRSNVEKGDIKEYDVYIESVNRYSTDNSKGMVLKITDPELISTTGGIVQGMSGSPIIQDGKLIGAITHVFVQDPSKGYGIFIENMLKQGS